MKRIISAVLLLMLVTVVACKKDDKKDSFPYKGDWSGTYSGLVSGNWDGNISESGVFTGTGTNNLIPGQSFTITGTVSKSGVVEADYTYLTLNVSFDGQIQGDNITGTWMADTLGLTGTWAGARKK
ncbi:MAG TPA: hypothetical protein VL098_07145 [Flavipsychrobacter sp.]|nr:hypothetical protein [Flavipsychrobacter sp.]